MRDTLPTKPWIKETGIVNLDDMFGQGTHWVCYFKDSSKVYYFDSFGNLPPPIEVLYYFRDVPNVMYNVLRVQNVNTMICGHLCLEFLVNKTTHL